MEVAMSVVDLTSGFRCPVCNGNQVELPAASPDDASVSCANCNAILGTWREVRDAEGPMLSKKAEQVVKDVLQAAVPNWQVK
jgi:hypothetical protein